jgi:hypothetical protein
MIKLFLPLIVRRLHPLPKPRLYACAPQQQFAKTAGQLSSTLRRVDARSLVSQNPGTTPAMPADYRRLLHTSLLSSCPIRGCPVSSLSLPP